LIHLFPDYQSVRIAVFRFWLRDPEKENLDPHQHKKIPQTCNPAQSVHNLNRKKVIKLKNY